MKRLNQLLLMILLVIAGSNAAYADVVKNYTMNFDSPIVTTEPNFKAAPGWAHIANKYTFGLSWDGEDVYPTYSYAATEGRNGSGALKVGTQTALTHPDYTEKGSTTDLLVTPKLNGTASIYVKKATEYGTVKFYKATKSTYANSFNRGALMSDVTIPELSTTEWTRIDLPAQENAYVGIYGSDVYFDDFAAESADIIINKSLKLQKVLIKSSTTPDCDAEGNVPFSFEVTLKNMGDCNLAPGDENYSLSLINYSNKNAVLYTTPIAEALAMGETKTLMFEGTIKKSELIVTANTDRARVDVKENISNTSEYGGWLTPIAYEPKMVVKQGTTKIAGGEKYAWGKVNAPTAKAFTIENTGAAPLNVTAITLPEGFSADVETPVTVAPHEAKPLNISLSTTTPGDYSGDVTISAEGFDPLTISVSGTMLDPEKFYVSFEDNKLPAGSYVESSDWLLAETGMAAKGNAYFLKNKSQNKDDKFVTPLLNVAEGEKLSVDVARGYYTSTGEGCYLNVYYSDDRENWTLARKITATEMSGEKEGTYGHYEGKLSTFDITGIPAGNHYIGFGAGYVFIDNIYGFKLQPVAHDWKISGSNIPANGMVNNKYTATASLFNINAADEEAGSYTATLYLNDEAVVTAEAGKLSAGNDSTFVFTFTPHETGTYQAYIEFKATADGHTAKTATAEVKIGEELASKTIQVGNGTATNYNTPINWWSADNALGGQSDILYKAAMLQEYGLKEGERITSVTYTGKALTSKDFTSMSLDAYVGMVDGTGYTNNDKTDGLQHISLLNKKAFSVKQDEEYTTTITFNEPLVWDGSTSLRVYTDVTSNGNRQYVKINYPLDATYKTAGYKKGSASSFDNANTPIAYIGVEIDPMTVSGSVTSKGNAVAGAKIMLTSGDVLYSGSTAEDGTYSINVIQTGRKYKMQVTAEGYVDYEETDSLDVSAGAVRNIELTKATVKVDGKVVYKEAGLAGATVTLSEGETVAYSATTGEAGEYTFDAVEPGKAYTVKVTAEKFNAYTAEAPVQIDEAKTLDDIVMTKPDFKVYGVAKWGETPLEGVEVKMAGDGLESISATTDAEGKYELTGVKADEAYTLTAEDKTGEFKAVESQEVNSDVDTEKNFAFSIIPISVSIDNTGVKPFSYKRALDFSGTAVKAYVVKKVNRNYTELTEIQKVPAGCGVILKADADEHSVTPVEKADAVEGNLLVGTVDKEFTIEAASVGKAWSLKNNDGIMQFMSEAGTKVAKNSAYLAYESTESVIYLNQADGIRVITTSGNGMLDESKPMYNLAGQRVGKDYKGVVIQNGKKYNK